MGTINAFGQIGLFLTSFDCLGIVSPSDFVQLGNLPLGLLFHSKSIVALKVSSLLSSSEMLTGVENMFIQWLSPSTLPVV